MYALWFNFLSLFLVRRCRATLDNGRTVKWLRPKNISSADYRAAFEGWKAAAHNRIKLDSGRSSLVINSDNIVSFEIR